MNPVLKAPGTKRLTLKGDKLLSSVAFNYNLRRYNVGEDRAVWEMNRHKLEKLAEWGEEERAGLAVAVMDGRGLHSFPIQLNLSSSVNRITRLSS